MLKDACHPCHALEQETTSNFERSGMEGFQWKMGLQMKREINLRLKRTFMETPRDLQNSRPSCSRHKAHFPLVSAGWEPVPPRRPRNHSSNSFLDWPPSTAPGTDPREDIRSSEKDLPNSTIG
ncbi:Serine/Threonine-Protein Phosphatase 2A 56 Kda Regulatory Subunit Beta Isoform [Manis pentadactyla]|nr:Serine/Threonine-Protein Phosphatase 2A 56 Kda Regulatory Subunit Beta Isoform [Manis pentadactyla]